MQTYILLLYSSYFLLIDTSLSKTYPEPTEPTSEWHQQMVSSHTKLRRTVIPAAGNMNQIVFNQTLADLAIEAAQRCDFKHSWSEKKIEKYYPYGENIFKGGYITADRVVFQWFNERYFYTYNEPWTTTSCESGKVCGHYKQVAAYTVGQIGCGYKRCPHDEWLYIYCLYNRGGRDPPYYYGEDCSSCMEGYNFCHNGLCISNEIKTSSAKTCELKCRNCGILNKENCTCTCPEGTIGTICECSKWSEIDCLPNDSKCKGVCLRRGTPCQNGGTDVTTGNYCKCKCSDGFTGSFCEVRTSEVAKSVIVKLKGKVLDSRIFPISKYEYLTDLAPKLYIDLAKAVFDTCSDSGMFKKCCEKAVSAPEKRFTDDTKITYIPSYPQNNADGELIVQMIGEVDRCVCPGNGYLSPDVLAPIVNATFFNHPTLVDKEYKLISVEQGPKDPYPPKNNITLPEPKCLASFTRSTNFLWMGISVALCVLLINT